MFSSLNSVLVLLALLQGRSQAQNLGRANISFWKHKISDTRAYNTSVVKVIFRKLA